MTDLHDTSLHLATKYVTLISRNNQKCMTFSNASVACLRRKKNPFPILVYYWRKLLPDRAVFMIGFSYFKYETNSSVMCFWWWSTLQYLRHHFPWPSPCVQSHKPYSLFRGPIMQNRSSVQAWQSRLKRSTYHHRFPSLPWQD